MEALDKLRELTAKKEIKLAESGDHAILSVLQWAKKKGKEKVLIQNQGGWLTYRDYPKKAGLSVAELKTDYGIIDMDDLKSKADSKSILLVNSLNGYFSEQPMYKIQEICADKKCIIANDISGSIGTETGRVGDILLCSFGKDKPVNLNYGGCIAFDNEHWQFEGDFDDAKLEALDEELDRLFEKQMKWEEMHWKIKQDLVDFDIIHRDLPGINVVVRFENEEEKEKILDYCKKNKLEYTLCPRYIRVNCNAVSIEVKRAQ